MINKHLLQYLELAVDEQPIADSSVTEQAEGGTEPTGGEPTTTEPTEPSAPSEWEIDGEKVSLDQLREFKRGYMRQSDYTKKTQEIASMRKESTEAMELYNYLKANPEIAKKLAEIDPTQVQKVQSLDPVARRIDEIEMRYRTDAISKELERITKDDKDVTELELLEIANSKMMNIEDAYAYWKGQNVDKIVSKRLAEQSKNLTKEIQKNAGVTKTLINSGDQSQKGTTHGLSDLELSYADKLGMSPEEYAKWK